MKKTRSKKSRDTVPLSLAVFTVKVKKILNFFKIPCKIFFFNFLISFVLDFRVPYYALLINEKEKNVFSFLKCLINSKNLYTFSTFFFTQDARCNQCWGSDRIRMCLGLLDPDPLVRGTDPAPDPDPSFFS